MEAFYEKYVDVRVVVNCTNRPSDFVYKANHPLVRTNINPRAAPSQIQHQYDVALPKIIEALEDGHDVVVHCEKTFHRAIAVIGGLMRGISNVDPQVYW